MKVVAPHFSAGASNQAARRTAVIAIWIVSVTACTPAQDTKDIDTTQSDLAAIQSVHDQFVAGVIDGNPKQILGTLDQRIVVMPDGGQSFAGLHAATAWLEKVSAEPLPGATYETDEVLVSGDLAVERGTYWGGMGKRIWVYRRQNDGAWKISHIVWNRNPQESEAN